MYYSAFWKQNNGVSLFYPEILGILYDLHEKSPRTNHKQDSRILTSWIKSDFESYTRIRP